MLHLHQTRQGVFIELQSNGAVINGREATETVRSYQDLRLMLLRSFKKNKSIQFIENETKNQTNILLLKLSLIKLFHLH